MLLKSPLRCVLRSSYRGWLWVDRDTALPRRLELPSGAGGPEAWTFSDWPAEAGTASAAAFVPRRAVRINPTGQRSVFLCAEVALGDAAGDALPPVPPPWAFPAERQRAGHGGARFLAEGPSVVPAARCEGGQFLVAGALSAQPAAAAEEAPTQQEGGVKPVQGWFLLDTACDTAALSRSAADAAALPPRFGQQAVFGVGGPVVSALRVAPSLRLGALELADCLAMELQLDGAVRLPSSGPAVGPSARPGPPLPLAGILGGALLLRTVVDISAPKRVPGAKDAPQVSVTVHDPATFEPEPRVAVSWQEVTFIDGAPHIAVGFNVETDESVEGQRAALQALRDLGAPDGEGGDSGGGCGGGGDTQAADLVPRLGEREGFGATRDGALFKVGLGLGGAPVVLGARSARRLQFAERTVALAPTGLVSGPGSEQGRLAKARPLPLGIIHHHTRCLLTSIVHRPTIMLSLRPPAQPTPG